MLATSLLGCSSVGGSAIRTGSAQFPAYHGAVAVYPMGTPPAGATDLGLVEVHAVGSEGTVEVLIPKFIEKVAEIGGDVAVIEGIRARFDLVGRPRLETFYYTCGMGVTCAGTRMYNTTDEQVLVSVFGHAYRAATEAAPLPPQPPPAPSEVPPLEEEAPEPMPVSPSSASRQSPSYLRRQGSHG